MKHSGKGIPGSRVIALALTWDGARWPAHLLPLKARAFLGKKSPGVFTPTSREAAQLFSNDRVKEIRICWVPRLKGGREALSESYQTASEMRLAFQPAKTRRMGDILGVIYRRQRN